MFYIYHTIVTASVCSFMIMNVAHNQAKEKTSNVKVDEYSERKQGNNYNKVGLLTTQ